MEHSGVGRAFSVWQPQTAEEAWSLKRRLGSSTVYAGGGTLLRVWWEGGAAAVPAHLIDVRSIPGFAALTATQGGGIAIGAGVTLAEVRRSPALAALYPALVEAAVGIAAPSVRNLGTLGGNVACGIGDALPALLVHDAVLLRFNGAAGSVPLDAWLKEFEAGGQDDGGLLLQIELQGEPAPAERFSIYRKVGRREAFAPSVMTAALAGRIAAEGELSGVRIAAGGGSMVPQRLYAVEEMLEGRKIESSVLADVHEAVLDRYRPRGDAFAGEAYRRRTAANVIAAELWRLANEA